MMPMWAALPASLRAKRRKTTKSTAAPAPMTAKPPMRTRISAR